jgi:hypothetical protein
MKNKSNKRGITKNTPRVSNRFRNNIENSKEITLKSLIDNNSDIESVLYQFSNFISSNPDYKYNSTYLTDEITRFKNDKKVFIKKQAFLNSVVEQLKNDKNADFSILFDNVFHYNLSIQKYVNEGIDNAEKFRFDLMGSKQIIVEFKYNEWKSTFIIKDFTSNKAKNEIKHKFEEFIKQVTE